MTEKTNQAGNGYIRTPAPTGQVSQARLRAFINSTVAIIAKRLVIELGLPEAQADEIARDCSHDVASVHGGTFMYVPKDIEYELSKRDLAIYEEFNGRNLHQLVEKYGVTHTRIYQIVAKVKAKLMRDSQGVLPGLED